MNFTIYISKLYQLVITLILALPLLWVNTAESALSAQDQKQIKDMIEEYILTHPETLRDALISLARREQEQNQDNGLKLVYEDSDDPVIGPANAPITIYEFSDYNCGYCKRMLNILQDVVEDDNGVKLVVKEFPILSPSSKKAARVALAAHKQGKFADVHTALMSWRGQINDEAIDTVISHAKLNKTQMLADMQADSTTKILAKNHRAANMLQIKGTPALIIGDHIIRGAVSKKQILDLIKQVKTAKYSKDPSDILIINGPNLNMLGMREVDVYGTSTLADFEAACGKECAKFNLSYKWFHSDHEGELITEIQKAANGNARSIIINAAGYSHSSVALHDALLLHKGPKIEVHISNIFKRDIFRHHSYISAACDGMIVGLGMDSYLLAVCAIAHQLKDMKT